MSHTNFKTGQFLEAAVYGILECSGFNDNGSFKLEYKLGELFDAAEKYARELPVTVLIINGI